MKKILIVLGTRPEAIKLCPLIEAFKKTKDFAVTVCVTAQHRFMLDQVLDIFNISPDIDLDIMQENQSLFTITSSILNKMEEVVEKAKPDIVIVQGDTTTAFVAAMAAFYKGIAVAHVEAGLRTNNIYSPFPEEFNRQAIGLIAKFHFAPTNNARDNLIREGKSPDSIIVTGNTGIDALRTTVMENYTDDVLEWVGDDRLILITAHRRENQGHPMKNMFTAIKRVVEEHEKIKAVYPIHKNPKVREMANNILCDTDKIKLIEPLDVVKFHNYMKRSYLILTDSGGIQEEAPSLGKPVIVMRNTTERPEGIEAGVLLLAGTSEKGLYDAFSNLLDNQDLYRKMSVASNPYGDGFASERIVEFLRTKMD